MPRLPCCVPVFPRQRRCWWQHSQLLPTQAPHLMPGMHAGHDGAGACPWHRQLSTQGSFTCTPCARPSCLCMHHTSAPALRLRAMQHTGHRPICAAACTWPRLTSTSAPPLRCANSCTYACANSTKSCARTGTPSCAQAAMLPPSTAQDGGRAALTSLQGLRALLGQREARLLAALAQVRGQGVGVRAGAGRVFDHLTMGGGRASV